MENAQACNESPSRKLSLYICQKGFSILKRILFIDRDGTLLQEAFDYQIDTLEELGFYPGMMEYLGKIVNELPYELAMVTNQDGLGTAVFPEKNFWPLQNLIMQQMEENGIRFSAVHIDKTFAREQLPTRKPGTGMLNQYIHNPEYDISNSFVIGDRITDMLLAKNLGCKGIWIYTGSNLGAEEVSDTREDLLENKIVAFETTAWKDIYNYLNNLERNI